MVGGGGGGGCSGGRSVVADDLNSSHMFSTLLLENSGSGVVVSRGRKQLDSLPHLMRQDTLHKLGRQATTLLAVHT